MKKVIALVTLVICCSMTTVMAQGGGQQMTPEQRTAAMKERFKALGLNDVQVDSVIAIENDMRTLRGTNFRDLTPDERTAKQKEVSDARNKRLEKALPADLAKKVEDAMAQQRRPGGGGGK